MKKISLCVVFIFSAFLLFSCENVSKNSSSNTQENTISESSSTNENSNTGSESILTSDTEPTTKSDTSNDSTSTNPNPTTTTNEDTTSHTESSSTEYVEDKLKFDLSGNVVVKIVKKETSNDETIEINKDSSHYLEFADIEFVLFDNSASIDLPNIKYIICIGEKSYNVYLVDNTYYMSLADTFYKITSGSLSFVDNMHSSGQLPWI